MALTLYRRHLAACIVRKSKISARAKRLAMDCDCPIWMYGRSGNSLVPRQSTGFNDLAKAEALRDSLIARSKSESAHGVRIDECVQKYLASHRHELGEKTYGQYELHLGRLQSYCERRGVLFMGELNVDLLETFKVDGLPGLADTSKSTVVAKLRCFLREAFRRGWITQSLVDRVKAHRAEVLQTRRGGSVRLVACVNPGRLCLNGDTSNRRSFFAPSVGICDIPFPIAMSQS